ncbi:MAG: response regulator [Sphingomonadaceae bacterium]
MSDQETLDGLRILLIEDEVVIAMTAEDMLEEIGCTVSAQASSFNEAMGCALEGDFDFALLDINLNGVMSLPIAQKLREAGKPFIFTTGYGSVGIDREFSDVTVVTKPYTIRTLSNAIQAARAGAIN